MPGVPSSAEKYAERLQKYYVQAERNVVKTLADELGKDTYKESWSKIKLNKLWDVEEEIKLEHVDDLVDVGGDLEDAIVNSYVDGSNQMVDDLKDAGIKNINTSFASINRESIEALAKEAKTNLTGFGPRILRQADDVYRKAVENASVQSVTGAMARQEAAEQAIKKMANHGITGFTDTRGRNWSLQSYTDMATRTSTSRAFREGAFDRAKQNDRDLVIVSGHADCCALCAPWQGKVLSLSGKHPGYSSLDDAISGGLFHANCKHSVSPYIEGVTEKPDYERDEGLYEKQRIQRKNERQIRKWKRRKAGCITDKECVKANRKIRAWQAEQRDLLEGEDMRRLYYREKVGVSNAPKPLSSIPDTDDVMIQKKWLKNNMDADLEIANDFPNEMAGHQLRVYNQELNRIINNNPKLADKINIGKIKFDNSMIKTEDFLMNAREGNITSVAQNYIDSSYDLARSSDRITTFSVGEKFASTKDEQLRILFRHEVGHNVSAGMGHDLSMKWQREIFDSDRFTKTLSKYGGTSASEGFAEAFAVYTQENFEKGMLLPKVREYLETEALY